MDTDVQDIITRLMTRAAAGEHALPSTEADDNAKRQRNMNELLRIWQVPLRLREVLCGEHSETLRMTPVLEKVNEWSSDPRGWSLVLSGSTGSGKSLAAAAWLRQVGRDKPPNQAFKPRWLYSSNLARTNIYSAEMLDHFCTVRELVIDDMGSEYMDVKGLLRSTLDNLVEQRCANMLKTIITTNLTPKEFRTRVGERASDRILGHGAFYLGNAPSMRRPK